MRQWKTDDRYTKIDTLPLTVPLQWVMITVAGTDGIPFYLSAVSHSQDNRLSIIEHNLLLFCHLRSLCITVSNYTYILI